VANTDLANDIGDLLQINGLGTKSTDMFGNNMPASPDNMIGIYESTGFEPQRVMGSIAAEVLNLQIIVRNTNPINGRAKMRAIFNVLDRFKGTIGATVYLSILARHMPFPIGADENRRERWSCNFIVHRV